MVSLPVEGPIPRGSAYVKVKKQM